MLKVRVVRDADGYPVEGARVRIEFLDGVVIRDMETGPDGLASISVSGGGYGTLFVDGLPRQAGDLVGTVPVRL